ncbi:hypothetical protein C2G38_2044395 [Gigaspora rosea]|uniref:Uncharacterized protein n=1 Tax=Gigaspora rosea TaxID=44941 RepID=A0A397UJF3_9GLOM|nr:hypothetical protein C2G38_2044395 [Gigaspora rosea]CAG8540455.1 22881_t:CDS:2 [Gigaspora rosea]
MSSIFCTISFIKNVSEFPKCCQGPLFAELIMIEQNTSLNILILDNFPTIHDLPISPAFGVFTGHVQDASTIKGETAAFRLRRDAYDSVTSSKDMMSILCKYKPAGWHQNMSDTTQQQPIFSVAGE